MFQSIFCGMCYGDFILHCLDVPSSQSFDFGHHKFIKFNWHCCAYRHFSRLIVVELLMYQFSFQANEVLDAVSTRQPPQYDPKRAEIHR